MKDYKLVVFDWDGTVMDSIGRIVSSMQNAAEMTNLPKPTQRDVEGIIGLSLPKAVKVLFPEISDQQVTDILASYREEFLYDNKVANPLFDGIAELLTALRDKGVMLAVATGKGRVGLDRVMKETDTTHFFDLTRGGDEAQSKPHPEMLQYLLNELKVDASEALMVGDSNFDMEMAQSAGVDRLGVTYGVHNEEVLKAYNPIKIAHTVAELHALLVG